MPPLTSCTAPSAVAATPARAPLGPRLLRALKRYFSHSVASREAVEHAWLDTGLGRLNRATLEDIGAPPADVARAELREAWKAAWALDATRGL
jgi:hypothetical protein